MVIVDTTVWIDYFRDASTPHTQWLDREIEEQRLGLTDIILCEVLQGVRDDLQFNRLRQELSKFEIFAMGGTELSLTAAQNYRTLRSRGYTIRKTIDTLIASFCLIHDHTLLHNDRDFVPFEQILGLRVVDLQATT